MLAAAFFVVSWIVRKETAEEPEVAEVSQRVLFSLE
jgi:hypothetical protein